MPSGQTLSILAQAQAGNDALLPLLVLLPLFGALAVALFRNAVMTRTVAIGTALLTLAGVVMLMGTLSGTGEAPAAWSLAGDPTGVRVALSADGISAWLVALAAILTPCAMLATRPELERPASFFAWLLVLEATIIGAFLSSDLILFYVFFELTLVPSFLLIGQWGGADKRAAAMKFFVYTFTGSLFMLASIDRKSVV